MIAPLVLLLVVVFFRVASGIVGSADIGWLHNFSPIAAIALCGAVYLPRRVAWALPLAMLFVSDVVLNVFHYHVPLVTVEIVPRYLALALITGLGFSLRGKVRLPGMLGGSLAGSLLFYVITNTGSWLGEPAYAKTFGGWIQALTTGVPGWPSTWWFYRNTLISDLLFTALFAGCMALQPHRRERAAPLAPAPWA